MPDARLGQAIVLVVRGEEERGDALKAALVKTLPGFMQPHAIHWRAAMPLGPNGKIDRVALAEELAG